MSRQKIRKRQNTEKKLKREREQQRSKLRRKKYLKRKNLKRKNLKRKNPFLKRSRRLGLHRRQKLWSLIGKSIWIAKTLKSLFGNLKWAFLKVTSLSQFPRQLWNQ